MNNLAEVLLKRIEYAKTSVMPNRELYCVHGQITMAFQLKGISENEYLKLDHECVYEGINNPKYFK